MQYEDGRIVAGEQFFGDDEALRVLARLAEGFADACLFLITQVIALEMRRVVVRGAITTALASGGK